MELPANKKADLTHKLVSDRLQAAAGANYDKEQNAAQVDPKTSAHEFGQYKESSKKFFQEKEKSGNVQNARILYDTKALPTTTPVDLGHRAMTVGAAAAAKNTVDLKTAGK